MKQSILMVAAAVLFAASLCSGGEGAVVSGKMSISADGKAVSWRGASYRPIDDSGVFYYDPSESIGCPMPDPGLDLKRALERNGFHGVVRCRLVDYVDCASASHSSSSRASGFRESGGSRVLKLGSDAYRLTTPSGKLGWFSYDLATKPVPGKPHLVVLQLINDRERYTTITMNQGENTVWAAPYTGEEKHEPKSQEGNTWRCDVGATSYTGREYHCDGKPYTFVLPFYPKSDRAKITISHRNCETDFDELNGAAVARIWMFDVLDPLPAAVPQAKSGKEERKLALYVPHPWFLYSQFGLPCREEGARVKSLEETVRYLKFCGFNQIQLHIIDGSDRAGAAWYDSKFYPQLEGNLFKELLPIAEREGLEVVPIVAPIMAPFNNKPSEAPATPDKHGWSRDSCSLDRDGEDYTRAFGAPAPNPLRPEVQDWQIACLKEILDRCAKSPAVPAVGFRVNGKIGLCFTGEGHNKCGQDAGYNEWMVEQFSKDTGKQVPKLKPTSYQWIRDNCWDEWLQWRCVRMREFWLKCRDFVKSYRPDLKFIAACDLPSEWPGYNIEWPSGQHTIRDLFRHHGYDPGLFANDEGMWIQRGMMVASDRYWYGSWFPPEANAYAHKMFNYAPGVAESYDVPDSSRVELYHNYWEEDPHPDNEYGPYMRTATPVAYKDFFYEPAAFSIRKVNVDTIALMGWERACAGHEHDLRRFARAFRAIPRGEPRLFDGEIKVVGTGPQVPADRLPRGYAKPEPDVLSASWYGETLVIINDAFCSKDVRITLKQPLKKGHCLVEQGSGRVVHSASQGGKAEFVLLLHPFDLQVLKIRGEETTVTAQPVQQSQSSPVSLRIAGQKAVIAGDEAAFDLVLVSNSGTAIRDVIVSIRLPQGWRELAGEARTLKSLAPGKSQTFRVRAETDMSAAGTPGEMEATVSYAAKAGRTSIRHTAFALAEPPVTVLQENPVYWAASGESPVTSVTLRNGSARDVVGTLSLELPEGWKSASQEITLAAGESRKVDARVEVPRGASSVRRTGRAVFTVGQQPSGSVPVVVDVAMRCPFVPQPAVPDGKLAEWREGAVVIDTSQFSTGENADAKTIDAVKPKTWFAWDDNCLYIATATATTAVANTFGRNDLWKGDSLQFAVDPRRMSPGPRASFEFTVAAGEGGKTRVWRYRAAGEDKGEELSADGFAVSVGPAGTVYEAAVKWADLGSKPRAGDVIGVSLLVNRLEGGKRRVLAYGGGIADEKDPSRYVSVRLEQ